MKLNCPTCKEPLGIDYRCKNEHQYLIEEGILKLLQVDFGKMLDSWLVAFESYRSPRLQKLDFNSLPESGVKVDKNIWNARKEDLRCIDLIISSQCKTALDIGSWNGWLANQLGKRDIRVVAIDYFVHELDGMRAKFHYDRPDWDSIQMDLEDLSIIRDRFDLIVINRCFPYFTERNRLIDSVLEMLTPNGQVIITGLNVSSKQVEAKELNQARIQFRKIYSRELTFKPFKGYVDQGDIMYLKSKGFKIWPYPNLKNRIKRTFFQQMSTPYYGVYSRLVF